jgi:DNA/RNA endonuclease G (NUC1)
MRTRKLGVALIALTLAVGACSDNRVVGPSMSPVSSLSSSADGATQLAATALLPEIRISEIHYDNASTDAGERVEISGPAGADLSGWQLVLYNGSGGAVYNTTQLSGTIPATCGSRGVVVIQYPVNGIQNGAPDGIALVSPDGDIEFLSYEGTFTAVGGPADGLESTDIVVSELGEDAVGNSLFREGAGADWNGPSPQTFGACNDAVAPPPPVALEPTRIAEIHYDNDGGDIGEAIEVEGPAGTSLAGWTLVLYNGNGGASYNTRELNGTIPDQCDGRGALSFSYANVIQNGSPDGVALVHGTTVVEFLSYEGRFTATNGPANGMTSTNIRVAEPSDMPIGLSLQRLASGTWQAPVSATFGLCNKLKPPPASAATVAISELMADPLQAAGGASWGEWFEVHNYGSQPVDLQGWTILSSGQPNHTIASSVVVPASGFAVLGRGADPTLNGGITLAYNYFTGTASTIFLDARDVLELRDAAGATVDRVQWTNSATMVRGVTRGLRDASADNANVAGPNWGYSTVTFGDGDFGTPGTANGTLSDTPPAVPNFLSFSGRTPSDVPLPVGFQDQIFATLRNSSGNAVETTITWKSETPDVASIDGSGVMAALRAGTAILRATAADGTTRTYSLPVHIASPSATAQYAGNAEFGEAKDADATDDFIVRHTQYTASYNRTKGTPNWVSYNLEETHFGSEDRCDCFTFDPALPANFTRYTTADYTGAGTFHGYGIDRGHLARSFDRTSGSLDNAFTFYFTNIIPQAADNNQGPWSAMEFYLGDLARLQNKEVYIVAGVAGSKGTVKNEGKITIPTHVWKVAVIMRRDQGLRNINDHKDLEIVAAVMPNEPGIRNVNWETYKTTVDAVEALSGYNLLELLPDGVEGAVESELKPALLLLGQLTASGNVNSGDRKWLDNKLELAAVHLARGLRIPAVNQLEDVLRRLNALVRTGNLSEADAESLSTIVRRVITSVSS